MFGRRLCLVTAGYSFPAWRGQRWLVPFRASERAMGKAVPIANEPAYNKSQRLVAGVTQ